MFDRILKYLGVVSTVIVFVMTAVFFLGGEWQQWEEIKTAHKNSGSNRINLSLYVKKSELDLSQYASKSDLSNTIKNGDRISIQSFEGYLYSLNSKGIDELDVIISGTPMPWKIEKEK